MEANWKPLETAYDDAYVTRKEAALRAAGIEVLRIRIVPEDRVVLGTPAAVAGELRMR